jgi:hypothetical protein
MSAAYSQVLLWQRVVLSLQQNVSLTAQRPMLHKRNRVLSVGNADLAVLALQYPMLAREFPIVNSPFSLFWAICWPSEMKRVKLRVVQIAVKNFPSTERDASPRSA